MLPVDIQIIKYLTYEKLKFNLKSKPYIHSEDYLELKQVLQNIPDADWEQEALSNLDYTIFDLETTGFYPALGHEIISIGAIRFNGSEICRQETFYEVVRPFRSVNKEVLQITGLSKERLDQGSIFLEVFKRFLEFSEGTVLVAHPAKFDVHFLQTMLKRWKLPAFHPHFIDSQLMAQWLLPDSKHQLDPLLKHFGIRHLERHHALNDARMTAELFQTLLSMTLEHNVDTFGQLHAILNKQKAKQ